MFKSLLALIVALVVAIGGGAGSVYLALEESYRFGTIEIGPWTAYPEIGTPAADPYSRARFAREGALALGQAEGLVFMARVDSLGLPLDPACVYAIEGDVPPARFWTLHATDETGHPWRPDGAARRSASLHSQSLLRAEDGSAVILASARIQPGNWLRLPQRPGSRLVLTLYDTTIAGSARVASVVMPRIVRSGCDD